MQSETGNLTAAAREMHSLRAELAAHVNAAKTEEARLREEIRTRAAVLSMSSAGIDMEKVALGKTIIAVRGSYAKGGEGRASVCADAIKQLATGEPPQKHYGDLWRVFFGTKNYDRWRGQREDCQYGYGPRHGSTVFAVGLTDDTRRRDYADLTADEVEAAIYYITNLGRVQAAEAEAREQSAA